MYWYVFTRDATQVNQKNKKDNGVKDPHQDIMTFVLILSERAAADILPL